MDRPRVSVHARWSRTRIGLTVFAGWTVLAVLSVLQNAVVAPRNGTPFPWLAMTALHLADWYGCLLFVPAFVWLLRRFPPGRIGWTRSAAVLFVASAVFVVAKYAIQLPINRAITGRADITLPRLLAANALVELIIFWAVIAVILAIDLHHTLREQRTSAALLHAQLVEAQLDSLSAQLQPHFLFNTLAAIATLLHRDPNAADQMITRLSDLLRATLASGSSHEISLDEELTLLDRYLDIMRIRFSDHLTIHVEASTESRLSLIPRLLLQPLVENALEHGVARHRGPGVVRIAAVRDADTLVISVQDNGVGFAARSESVAGIGLANTHARLARLHGDRYQVALSAPREGGAMVTVTLPWRISQATR